MKRLVVWVLVTTLVLSLSAFAAAKHGGGGPKHKSQSTEAPVMFEVAKYVEFGFVGEPFRITLDQPKADGSFWSNPVEFRVASNHEVDITIKESFVEALYDHYKKHGWKYDELVNFLNPYLLVNDKSYKLPLKQSIRLPSQGERTYSLQLRVDWDLESDWWKLTPVEGRMGEVIITIACH